MLIKPSKIHLRNKSGVSRSDRYRGKIKVTEQDRRDHLSIDWNPNQVPSTLLGRDGERYKIANVRWGFEEMGDRSDWKPRFSDTEIDTSKVKDVYLTLQPFKPEAVAAHGLIIFEMEDDTAVTGADGQKDFGLALSVEARTPKGEGYSLLRGLKKSFGQVYQLGTLSDQIQKVGRQRGHKLVLHRLNLDQEQRSALLKDSLEAATEDRLGEWYHLLTNSCITADIDLINGVLPESQQMARWSRVFKFARPATMLPTVAGATLKKKGLLAEEPVKVLNPDPTIFPDIQHKKTGLHKALGPLSRSFLWKPAFVATGAGIGGIAGHALGASFGQVGAVVGAGLGALSGGYLGDRSADLIAVKTDIEVENGLEWYAKQGGLTAEEAQARVV